MFVPGSNDGDLPFHEKGCGDLPKPTCTLDSNCIVEFRQSAHQDIGEALTLVVTPASSGVTDNPENWTYLARSALPEWMYRIDYGGKKSVLSIDLIAHRVLSGRDPWYRQVLAECTRATSAEW